MKRGATKEYVLNMLEQNKGNYITGMKVAEDLGITRNAVWKAINELKKEGYTIHSISRRGYALDESSDILSAAAIKKRLFELSKEIDTVDKKLLENSINVVADNIIIFDSLESTNQTAKIEMITGFLNKRIIIAKNLTIPIEDKSHKKIPLGEGIFMSIALDDNRYVKEELTSRFIGKTVKKALEEATGKKVTLNDSHTLISIGKKPIGGIKSEYFADLGTDEKSAYIIGIGLKFLDISANDIIARILLGFGV